jgi:hypothetical protein
MTTQTKSRSSVTADRASGNGNSRLSGAAKAFPGKGSLESIEQAIAKRTPGITERPKRVKEWKLLEKLRIQAKARHDGEVVSELEAEEAAAKAWLEFGVNHSSS